ncbi:hypothetical protein OS493_032843 [Desmophyllum pertusum]|uniref:Uncharacterized protein n=1 Tax=Desmophyllum pertusum TaxID=174260 RepID=A0A9W9YZ95_9CNID|nr:hypothetical protein OS493_032843 [Desmophyllum pertusum]
MADSKNENSPQERVDVLSGVPYRELSDLMDQYQADRIWNETQIASNKLEQFNTFVSEEILPRICEADGRFDFEEVIPTGSFKEHSVISQKTNFQNYIEHEFDFMLVLRDLGANSEGVTLVDCVISDEMKDAFKHVIVKGATLKRWQDCCVYRGEHYLLDADKIMQSFEKIVSKVMDEMTEREEGFVPGCIDITRNGPAVTLQFDIAKLPLEMQSPYPEDVQGVALRKHGYNCINNWSIDLVLCVEAGQVFNPYDSWASRQRKWPSKDEQSELLGVPAHLVAKSIDSIPQSWRLSTSRAELLLAESINKQQPLVRNCWLVLKAVLKAHLSQPKFITSYNLKTILFYIMDRVPADYWTKENLPELLLGVIDAIIIGLGSRSFPHYFLTSVNLLSQSASEDHIAGLLQKCCQVRAKPDKYLASTPNFETYLTELL